MATAKKPQLVEVEWLDARSVYEQFKIKDAAEKCILCRRLTMGYVILKDKERLIVAHTYDPAEEGGGDDEAADFTVIPRGWVVSIVDLAPVVVAV